jgi:hypothetical protein
MKCKSFHLKVTVPMVRPPPLMELQRTPMWSNSPPCLSNSSSKEKLTSSRKNSRNPKAVKWLLPLHQMKKPMLHPKKKPMTRKREREIRDLMSHPVFKAKTRCSSYLCPGSSCHTYGQNVNTEYQCLYYIVSYYNFFYYKSRKD